jgi:trehalose-phosphatase
MMNEAPTTIVKALFLDYDGTISSIDASKSNSTMLSANKAVLQKISKRIPIAVITTKDLSFIMGRTQFAHAWAGIAGLEMKSGNTTKKMAAVEKKAHYIEAALRYATDLAGEDLKIEEKRFSNGITIAFSVDWRQAGSNHCTLEKSSQIQAYCDSLPLFIVKYGNQPFFDVFPCPVDKGKALLALKKELNVLSGVLYMGDSILDNPAFEKADVAVGVLHEETPPNLSCDFFINFKDVPTFLRSLLESNFYITSNREAIHVIKA